MLAALLLAGLVAAPVTSAALFVPVRPRRRVAGTWPATRRLVLALLGTVLLAAVVGGGPRRARRDPDQRDRRDRRPGRDEPAVAAGDPALERARAPVLGRRACSCSSSYLAFMLCSGPSTSGLGGFGTTGGVLLWLLEAVRRVAGLRVPVGALRRARHASSWRRRITRDDAAGRCRAERPAVREPARAGAQRAAGDGDRDADARCCGSTTRATRSSSSTTTPTTRRCGGRSRAGAPRTA